MKVNIYIDELRKFDASARSMHIPVLPEKIKFSSGGARFIQYDIIDRGEVYIPSGENLRRFKWESFFPGRNRLKSGNVAYAVTQNYLEPKAYQTMLSEWKAYHTPLRLLITGTPINHQVYLYDYNIDYQGGMGDYYYGIEFIDRRLLDVQVTKPLKTEEQSQAVSANSTDYQTYTVVSGDNLWKIARKFYGGSGSDWEKIYNANVDAIESAAKKYGRSSSNNGWWIYPGTVLKIPA